MLTFETIKKLFIVVYVTTFSMSESIRKEKGSMGKNVAVGAVVCFMLCLSLNSTFPLHRDITTSKTTSVDNHSRPYEQIKQEHRDGIVFRTKKMAMNLENVLRKFVDSTPNKPKCSHTKNGVVDSDLSNYEQLVIMKKYPFLDLQELDFNLRSPSKNTGQEDLNSAQVLSAQDPNFCESPDEGPNVEITNRGLSGFALPTKLAKPENSSQNKIHNNFMKNDNSTDFNISPSTKDPPDDLSLIESLEEDIKIFEKHLG